MAGSETTQHFEDFMKPAEGTPSCTKFFARVEATGFEIKKGKPRFNIAEFDADEKSFVYDPETFTLFTLFHEKQHQVVHEKALKTGISLRKLFNSKMMKICETDAYLAEMWLCERFDFPAPFIAEREALLLEYIHKARTALRNNEGLKELATQVLGYDIQARIERYCS
ncbi:MAG: hypothetical protein AAB489_03170 [Patescibacteria group bacterium]